MNERVIQIRKFLKLNQTEFAKIIGLSQTGLSCIEINKSIVTEQTIIALCSKLNVNDHWLRTGEGEMFNNEDKQFQEFFNIYKKLSPPLQNFLLDCAKNLLHAQSNL